MIFAMATRRRSTKSLLHLNRSLVSLIAALLIFTLQLSLCHAQSQPRLTRRPITKTSIEGSSERSVAPDQLAQAASRSDGQGRNYQRRGSVVHSRTKEPSQDYTYGQLELNLIRPEHETSSLPPHGKINAYYGSSTTQSNNVPHEEAHHDKALDESETAAEYVVNAMKMAYGTRHKDAQQPQLRVVAATQRPYHPSSSTEQQQQHQQQQQQQQHQQRQPQQQQYHEPQHQQQQQQHQQQQHPQLQHQQQHQQPQQQHHQQQQQQHLEQEAHKQAKAQAQAALLEAQMQAELQAQLVEQQALLLVEQQRQQHLQQQQQQPHAIESAASEASPPAPAPVYEKESGPRSYEIYETPAQPDTEPGAAVAAAPAGAAGAAGGDIERLYRTKYYSYPAPQPYRNLEAEAEEKVRVSASTEIPKAEIMKQIEKSVIKYMKELEAEGKIITTPQELAPPATKTYYKLLSLPNSNRDVASSVVEEKRYSSNGGSNSGGISGSGSTVRPKYSSSNGGSNHGRQPIAHISSQQHTQYHQQQQQSQLKPIAHALTKPQRYQAETETAYQAPELSAEALAPNVEFIYKIKTRAPLQTATVKTVSKPYTLPLKSSAEHFDHGAAMKNIEEFDLSHVVTTPERELEQERVTSKPQKLYFNSEIYHDINSLPYKGEKLRGSHLQHAAQEYRHKLKSSGELHPDYKGYSGYFAEPASSMELAEKQPVSALEGEESEEMGYPIPYQYVLKKEPLSSKYEEERESWESLRLAHGKPNSGGYKSSAAAAAGGSSSSSLDYDSYSPKFNNNPEGYGYQHTYKTRGVGSPGGAQSSGSNGIKRGKRGGGAHPQAGKKLLRGGGNSGGGGGGVGGATIVGGGKHMKDLEANLALRPPPKN
ncbi:uncharacterized protein LOC117567063 [Drosophila albomicans]|uniref:Uncharacterized protein LOC117567063 n=1 Tax=Drosophila albomicans TaxID=7291 RepID=A0A9C6T4U9_DROAB|nr:uncharacterized protein LOC117567063 [Drosophila albomicans]